MTGDGNGKAARDYNRPIRHRHRHRHAGTTMLTPHASRLLLRAPLLALALCTMPALAEDAPAEEVPRLSKARTMQEAGMVDVRSLAPDISQDIRYFGGNNFIGTQVDGYEAPRCWLTRDAAEALVRVDKALRLRHQRLRIHDCYRPARAVAHFMRWLDDAGDLRTKPTHYPSLEKAQLRGGYIAPLSGHSRGATVDVTLLQCDEHDAACTPVDMGTDYDFFGSRAHTDSREVTPAQGINRHLLREAMAAQGFGNYPMEWWHFTFQPDAVPSTYYDIPVTHTDTSTRDAAIDRLMQRYDGHVPGAALLVLKDGVPLVRRGYGRSDLAADIEAGPATNYRLASVSKQFTATAVLLLMQDGQLSIDDPVKRWLPSLPAVADAITLRHLLSHTSGVLDYEDLMAEPYPGQILDAGVLGLLEKQNRLYFPPGSRYRYSNSGYALLALVVERVSGMSFPDYLRARIFAPLGMRNTLARVDDGPAVPYRAFGYSETAGGWQFADQSATSAVLGDGGIYSNIDDLAVWDAALYDDRLLSQTSRALAFGHQARVSGESDTAFHYGFGWRVAADHSRVWHTGESIGFRNAMVRWPKQRLTVAVLSNRNEPSPYALALEIGALFLQPEKDP